MQRDQSNPGTHSPPDVHSAHDENQHQHNTNGRRATTPTTNSTLNATRATMHTAHTPTIVFNATGPTRMHVDTWAHTHEPQCTVRCRASKSRRLPAKNQHRSAQPRVVRMTQHADHNARTALRCSHPCAHTDDAARAPRAHRPTSNAMRTTKISVHR